LKAAAAAPPQHGAVQQLKAAAASGTSAWRDEAEKAIKDNGEKADKYNDKDKARCVCTASENRLWLSGCTAVKTCRGR